MDCDQARSAISALTDAEDPGVVPEALHEHLDSCKACVAWQEALFAQPPIVEMGPDPDDNVLPGLLRSLTNERAAQAERRARRALAPWRVGLVLVAVVQPALVLPSLLAGHWVDHAHDARELGSWHLALAVGFLFAAIRPARAWGMLPLVAALVAGLLVTAGIDVAESRVGLAQELAHVVDVSGVACLWALSVRVQRPVLRLRAT